MKKILLTIAISLAFITSFNEVSGYDANSYAVANLIGIEDGGEYDYDITVLVEDTETIMLDGVEIQNGDIINKIGIHTIELINGGIVDSTITFTVLPRFSQRIDGEIIKDRLILTLENEGLINVNGEDVDNGVILEKIGNYVVTVTGVNDYSIEYSFTIESAVLNYLEGRTYPFGVYLKEEYFSGIYLYSIFHEDGLSLTKYGTYSVTVLGLNDYQKTYNFNLGIDSKYLQEGKAFEGSIRIDQSHADKVFVNDVEVEDIFYITKVGNYEIRYEGLYGYVKIYNVTLKEEDLGIDGLKYETFKLKYSDYKLYLNGELYKSEDSITSIGHYKVRLEGINDYVSFYNITIFRNSILPNDETINEAITLNMDFRRIYVNGQPEENYRITESGDYKIVLAGAGNYIEVYEFTYINEHVDIARDIYYALIPFGGLVVIIYGALLWRRFKWFSIVMQSWFYSQ